MAAEHLEHQTFRRAGLGYIYEPPGTGIRFRFKQLSRSREPRAWLVVETRYGTVIDQANIKLLGENSVPSFLRRLEVYQAPTGDKIVYEWRAWLYTAIASVLQAEEQGAPIIKVGRLAHVRPPPDLMGPLVKRDQANQLYGPGGASKGYLSVALSVGVALGIDIATCHYHGRKEGEPVLYLDWEEPRNGYLLLNHRIQRVCRGLGLPEETWPEIDYMSPRAKLEDLVDNLAMQVDEAGYGLVVIDSASLAARHKGEHGSYEDVALALMDCIHAIPSTVLLIDHVNNEGRSNEKLAGKSFGSVMKGFVLRNTWEVKKEEDLGGGSLMVGLFQTKVNHWATERPIGLAVMHDNVADTTRFVRQDLGDTEHLQHNLTLNERLRLALLRSPGHHASASVLATEVDEKYDTVSKALRRGRFVQLASGEWGVAAEGEE